MKSLADYEAQNAAVTTRIAAERKTARQARARKIRKAVRDHLGAENARGPEARALVKAVLAIVEEGRHG